MDLSRVDLLIGKEKTERLRRAKVAVVGLGGVGSYVAESLCRSGIGSLLLVDADTVDPSNINRQLPALQTTMGRKKVDVVAERLLQINPDCRIETRGEFYNPGDFPEFFPGEAGEWDFIADCIDSLPSKIDLLAQAMERHIPVISAMGGGGKWDPSQLRLDDISKTTMCPLARHVRKSLRKLGIEKGLTVVYSLEPSHGDTVDRKPGTLVFVPASIGLMMGAYIVRRLAELEES